MDVTKRLLNYVKIYTTSDEESGTHPSSKRQFDLARVLETELKEMGASDVFLDDKCYLYAKLPATEGMESLPVIGLIAHMDTAPDFNGDGVNPVIHENYDGEDVELGNGRTLSHKDFPHIASLKGRTLITTDGSSLLGADDKAGVAEIMDTAERLIVNGEAHGGISICFTPDEEIGEGADNFDHKRFGADFAFTVDGGFEGEVAYENFNASSAEIVFNGVNVHPGDAKDVMINASLLAAEFLAKLPKDETPATTEGREGFYHLTDMKGNVEKAVLSFILRDHDRKKLTQKEENLKNLVDVCNQTYGAGTAELTVKQSYSNMLEIIKDHMDIVELANEATRAAGIEPITIPVRGGTDGARLSFDGLPCPNLGTGGYAFHGPFEHITKEGMEISANIIYYLCTHVKDLPDL
ncbi:MAG: peptidase T [Lachnospiraceae bacterium]|nr:peptidase T [Lachnospiraceae bacterium]